MTAIEPELAARVATAYGAQPLNMNPLSGGCIGQVYRLDMADGAILVAKLATEGGLAEEAAMLADLATLSDLPLPQVHFGSDDLLLMDFVESGGRLDAAAEVHAADLLAALHSISGPAFGYGRDTLIGPIRQPNPWTKSWVDFFRDQRLLTMGRRALASGHFPEPAMKRLENFCGRLERFIAAPSAPSLIHGDLWDGNILVRDGRVAALIDPAIYYADPEIELAFTTLFGTFGQTFFDRYNELRPIAPGFFEARRDIYNLYPLLVHTTLFGGHYGASVDSIVRRYS